MVFRVLLLGCFIVAYDGGALYAGDDSPKGEIPSAALQQSISSQMPESSSQSRALEIVPQTGSEGLLVIAPQPGNGNSERSADEAGREFKPSRNVATLDRNFRTDEQADGRTPLEVLQSQRGGDGKTYLGIVVQYTTNCYLGEEEHGLEIIKVDPNSPASAAGLRGGPEVKARAPVTATATGFLPQLMAAVRPLVEKAEAGEGDLIMAVDDERIHNQADLGEKMARLRPGDTMYLTILRPIGNGAHKTMKIAVRVGEWGHTYASAAGASASVPDTE